MKTKERKLKILIVGEGGIGKTCLVIRYAEGRFPENYIPVQYCKEVNITNGDITYKANIIDSGGKGEDFYRLRPIYYPETDVLVMCFGLNCKWSYDGLVNIWKTEIQRFLPNTPIILVGTKNDLERTISPKEAEELKETMKAKCYTECSSKEDVNVNSIFISALRTFIENLKDKKSKKKFCTLL